MISIHVLAHILRDQSSGLGLTVNQNTHFFIHEAENCLQNDSLNDKKTSNGPMWYLVRYIIRTFGVSTLFKVSEIDTLEWVLPFDDFPQVCSQYTNYILKANTKITNILLFQKSFVDSAAIYNPIYGEIRSVITRATKNDFAELIKLTEVMNWLLLA